MTQNFDANSTNVTEVRTNERTNIRTDKRKGENYIPVGINAGGYNDGNAYRLVGDAKKISREKGKVMGDDDLFGFEQEVLSEKVHKLVVIKFLLHAFCKKNANANV